MDAPVLANLRDISIIIVAAESIVIGIMIGVLIVQISRLMRLLREEVLPILYSTQETLSTVRGTTAFVGDHVVQPVVKVASGFAGVRRAVVTLFRGPTGDGRGVETKEA